MQKYKLGQSFEEIDFEVLLDEVQKSFPGRIGFLVLVLGRGTIVAHEPFLRKLEDSLLLALYLPQLSFFFLNKKF